MDVHNTEWLHKIGLINFTSEGFDTNKHRRDGRGYSDKKVRDWKTGTNSKINCTLNRLRIELLVKGYATIINQRKNVKPSTLQRVIKTQSQESVVPSKK